MLVQGVDAMFIRKRFRAEKTCLHRRKPRIGILHVVAPMNIVGHELETITVQIPVSLV